MIFYKYSINKEKCLKKLSQWALDTKVLRRQRQENQEIRRQRESVNREWSDTV